MKKYLFLVLCAGALFAACSSDDKVDEPQNTQAIAFTTFVNKTSKADNPVTTDNLNKMVVSAYSKGNGQSGTPSNTGVLLLNNATVSRGGTTGSYTWTYSPVVYWTASTAYQFAAVNEGSISGLTDSSFGSFSFTNADGQKDIVWATQTATTGTGSMANQSKVAFSFKHALCRVKFTLTFSDPNHRYAIGIKNVKLKGTHTSGSFALGDSHSTQTALGTWSSLEGTFTADYGSTEAISSYSANADGDGGAYSPIVTDYRYLIPGTYTEGSALQAGMDITLYIRDIANENWVFQQAFSYDLNNTSSTLKKIAATFVQGHSYNITATFKAKHTGDDDDDPTIDPEGDLYPIEFTVTDVTNYTDDETVTW